MSRGRRFATGKRAKAVCDRSGFVYPYREMITEPGTGLLVHQSEVDWENFSTHPQLQAIRDVSDAVGLANPRPERQEDTDTLDPFLQDSADSSPLLDNFGHELLVNRTYPITD